MENATIVITTLATIILLLQIVTIIILLSFIKAKANKELKVIAPKIAEKTDVKKTSEDSNIATTTKPFIEQKQKSSPSSFSGPSVDRTLRDINLKLKNAERDQEKARRKIKESIHGSSNIEHSKKHQDHESFKHSKIKNIDFKRRERDSFVNKQAPVIQKVEEKLPQINNEEKNVLLPQSDASILGQSKEKESSLMAQDISKSQEKPVLSSAIVAGNNFASAPLENTEILHGRKVVVRRRVLNEEQNIKTEQPNSKSSSEQNNSTNDSTSSSTNVLNTAIQAQNQKNTQYNEDINFGR
jgi:hypothetical protein